MGATLGAARRSVRRRHHQGANAARYALLSAAALNIMKQVAGTVSRGVEEIWSGDSEERHLRPDPIGIPTDLHLLADWDNGSHNLKPEVTTISVFMHNHIHIVRVGVGRFQRMRIWRAQYRRRSRERRYVARMARGRSAHMAEVASLPKVCKLGLVADFRSLFCDTSRRSAKLLGRRGAAHGAGLAIRAHDRRTLL